MGAPPAAHTQEFVRVKRERDEAAVHAWVRVSPQHSRAQADAKAAEKKKREDQASKREVLPHLPVRSDLILGFGALRASELRFRNDPKSELASLDQAENLSCPILGYVGTKIISSRFELNFFVIRFLIDFGSVFWGAAAGADPPELSESESES